ncbi:glycosyltransferase family 4 protein [Paraburkholderia aspalathi]|uniref:glycosyltransferase family 4 protein n=1 Tax=Paraburkholderia aspalathi TaxID=1324617 RepID=UPI0038BC2797
MRVGVDLHVLQGINQGSKTYLDNIYTSLCSRNSKAEFVFIFNKGMPFDSKWNDLGEVRNFEVTGSVPRLLYDARRLQKKHGLDVYHSQYISPIVSKSRELVTIHDVLFETHPHFFDSKFNVRSKLLVRRSALKAAHVLTVSEYSKEKIIELYGVPEHRISVTPNGVDAERFRTVNRSCAVEDVFANYGLRNFILTVGRLEPRKNHLGLLKAYRQLVERYGDVPQLAIVGQRDFGFTEVFDFIIKHGLEKKVVVLENVNFESLVKLYRSARFFVYPSFAEGFGIPPLEAMAAECAVVCSNTTSMKEIFSKDAEMINPDDIDSIFSVMEKLIGDDAAVETLRSCSARLCGEFTWDKSASVLSSVLDKLDYAL